MRDTQRSNCLLGGRREYVAVGIGVNKERIDYSSFILPPFPAKLRHPGLHQ